MLFRDEWRFSMRKPKKVTIILIGLMVFFSAFWLFKDTNKVKPKLSIFSWSSDEIRYNSTELLNDLIEYDFDRIFQSFSSELTNEEITLFVEDVTDNNIEVFGLSGTPEWALDPTGEGMIEKLDQIVEINHQLTEEQRIKGFVINVEPYTLTDFDWDDQYIQESYVSGMRNLYQAAEREGLELIVVIPYFYDTKGYKEVLSTFIHETSTEVAIMNYYREHEIDHLTFEAQEAKKADKSLMTIYEFKRPGEHGLTNKNTYFNEGHLAAIENADRLVQHYHDQTIDIAFHDYQAFREVIRNE